MKVGEIMEKEKFSYKKFAEMHSKDESSNEDQKYKDYYIPDILFKFSSLSEFRDNKINALKNDLMWLSMATMMNDYYEYNNIYCDISNIHYKEHCKLINASIKDWYVNSFAVTVDDNYPMWAYYAANNSGYCCEYKVKNKEFFYPIDYINNKIDVTKLVEQIVNSPENFAEMNKSCWSCQGVGAEIAERDLNKISSNVQKSILYYSYALKFAKNSRWSHENEVRLIYDAFLEINDMSNFNAKTNGQLYELHTLGLELSSITLGKGISNYDARQLFHLANSKNIPIYIMSVNERAVDYDFKRKRISTMLDLNKYIIVNK